MASGSSGRVNRSSNGFDFGSDDILCSYDDFADQEQSKGSLSEAVIGASSSADFHKSRIARSSVFPATSYSKPEDSFHDDMISIVEKSIKKHTDNLMRFLEGISSRLSQLELYCYNVDKSIGEMRSDLARDHDEADSKLKSLGKTVQEVHRSVQILRDKQELDETQKELAKLQLLQKGSSPSNQSQGNEEKTLSPVSDPQKVEDTSGQQNLQLALVLPNQAAPQQQPVAPPPSQAPPQNSAQQPSYFIPSSQLQNPQVITQNTQNQYLTPNPQYRAPHLQDAVQVNSQPMHSQVSQMAPMQPFPQYQQQWPQQLPQMRPPPAAAYPSYTPIQPSNPPPQETPPSSIQMQYSSVPQAGSRIDTVPYGYGGVSRTNPPQNKTSFGAQAGDGYVSSGPPTGNTYMIYDSEGGRAHHPAQQAHFPQGGYPPANASPHNPNLSQFIRNHPYRDLIEKLNSMGFRSDNILGVIQRLEESGQPVDFNAVLDKLNVPSHSSAGSQRGWTG